MLIELKRAKQFDSRSMEPCYVETTEITAIEECVVGERGTGSQITLKSGVQIRVWEDPQRVHSRIANICGEDSE